MQAAKRKTVLLWIIVSALLLCAPAFASSNPFEFSKVRAELSAEARQNSVEPSSLTREIAPSYYDAFREVASDSLVATRGTAATLESKLASRSMTRAEWKELSQLRRIEANGLRQVSRWGRTGLQPDDWVQLGGPTRLNYILSGKWQPGFGNKFAPFKNGETFFLPPEQIVWPSGWGVDGWWKGLFNQRIYFGAGL